MSSFILLAALSVKPNTWGVTSSATDMENLEI
jgi:hypothetical protein